MKKQWNKPELYVLLKTRPEESVLVGCKNDISDGAMSISTTCLNPGGDPLAPQDWCFSKTIS